MTQINRGEWEDGAPISTSGCNKTAGSTPLQLTHEAVDELEPAFSPDGSRLIYRSERDGGGIYIVPTLGGQEPRLLVPAGRRPRFSPDGRLIAYWKTPLPRSRTAGRERQEAGWVRRRPCPDRSAGSAVPWSFYLHVPATPSRALGHDLRHVVRHALAASKPAE